MSTSMFSQNRVLRLISDNGITEENLFDLTGDLIAELIKSVVCMYVIWNFYKKKAKTERRELESKDNSVDKNIDAENGSCDVSSASSLSTVSLGV